MNEELIKRIDEYLHTTAGALAARDILRDCRAALTKKYVPMTDDELVRIYRKHGEGSMHGLRGLQSEIIRRAGLEVQE